MFQIYKMRTKLLIAILIAVLLPLLLSNYYLTKISKETLEKGVIQNLEYIAFAKLEKVEKFARFLQEHVNLLSEALSVQENTPTLNAAFYQNGQNSEEYNQIKDYHRFRMKTIMKTYDYENLYIISQQGDIIFSFIDQIDFGSNILTGEYNKSELSNVVRSALVSGEETLSKLNYYTPTGGAAIFAASPIILDGVRFGAIVLQARQEVLESLFNDYGGLGETGKTVVAVQTDQGPFIALNNRNNPEDVPFKKVVVMSNDIPIVRALNKQSGSGRVVGGEGYDIIATWQYLDTFKAGIVVRIDAEEALEGLKVIENISALIVAISIALASVLALFISSKISKPIVSLTKATKKLAQGDFSEKLKIIGKGEIADLSIAFNSMAHDIEHSQNELNSMISSLQRSNQDLEQFAYIASHDLQEPLRKVQAFGDLLYEDYKDVIEGDGQLYIKSMQGAAGRMQTLINDLLRYSRVATKGSAFIEADLSVITQEVIEDLEIAIKESSATIEVGELGNINADPLQLRQLFQNLISNSLKFKKEGIKPIITINADVTKEKIRMKSGNLTSELIITFTDNGIGFDQKHSDKIFGIFQRLHGRSAYAGSGVGLALCRKICDRHGGTIIATGTKNEGTVFTVTLPVHQDDVETENG